MAFSIDNGRIQVSVSVNQDAVFSMVNTYVHGIKDAENFAAKYIRSAIRNEIFGIFVRNLTARAGPGWPEVYTDHLIAVLRTMPFNILGSGYGSLSVILSLEALGDYNDFERGAHHQALIGTENNPDLHAHHGYNPHPSKVTLPYGGEPLLNDQQRRQEFWEKVVIDRDFADFELEFLKGKDKWTLADHMDLIGYNVATFDEIAFLRTLAWGAKAPEWLLLENGSNEIFKGSKPVVYPVDFSRSVSLAINCISKTIFDGAIETLAELADASGAAINVAGQPFNPKSGRYTSYKQLLDINVPDYTGCFGNI